MISDNATDTHELYRALSWSRTTLAGCWRSKRKSNRTAVGATTTVLLDVVTDQNGVVLYPDGEPRRPGATKSIERELTAGTVVRQCLLRDDRRHDQDPDSGFHRYVGDRNILNGAAYTISVK